MTAFPRRGSVHWVALDKRRPAVVVSIDPLNEWTHHVLVVPISTAHRPMSWHVQLHRGEGGLASRSMAKCEEVSLVQRSDIEPRQIGQLSASRMAEISRAMSFVLGITSG
jgi:mRNA-degrading endonuclease toxin of MazEF toxin-antitoxin module